MIAAASTDLRTPSSSTNLSSGVYLLRMYSPTRDCKYPFAEFRPCIVKAAVFSSPRTEIRTLASRTQQATVEIQQMIEELQAGTGALNDIMEKTVGRAASSQQLITEVGQDIDKLSSHSDAVLEMSTQIATSSEEQSSVAEEITRNLDQVRHEASRVEESASASVAGTTGLKATATELAQALKGLKI